MVSCPGGVDNLLQRWPATVFFLRRLSVIIVRCLFPHRRFDGGSHLCLLQSCDILLAYAFTPFVLIREILIKLLPTRNLLHLWLLRGHREERFLDIWSLALAPQVALPARRLLLQQPHFHRLVFSFMGGDCPAVRAN